MTSEKLDNLVRIGQLKQEPPRADELSGLKRSGLARLADAERADLAFESRFDLAYNAAHALALYALRSMGYRAQTRYLAFQPPPYCRPVYGPLASPGQGARATQPCGVRGLPGA